MKKEDLFNKLRAKYNCTKYEKGNMCNIYLRIKGKVSSYFRLILDEEDNIKRIDTCVYYTGRTVKKAWIDLYLSDVKEFMQKIYDEEFE